MRILVIIALALTLTACGGSKKTLQIEEKSIVVMPPEGLWNCPNAPLPPEGVYTQADVADYVLKLYEAHQVCEASIEAVRRYLEKAKLITEKGN
jgi:hypothetical protein